ncbi:MAG: amidohydrolase family protein [bacterium]|nr:amidohydrolase family protein [bacterium]
MILIKGARIVDGGGSPAYKGDILIKNDRISAIGTLTNTKADIVLEGLGLTVTPGFIDMNTDSDHYATLFTNPLQEDFLLQGVTTIIGGQCGSSLAPLLYGSLKSIRKWADTNAINVNWSTIAELKQSLARLKFGVNFATLVGHSTVRRDLIGEEIRDLTQPELDIFSATLERALREGARGLSTGLGYTHAHHVPFSEIKLLLGTVLKHNAVYTTHLRDETVDLVNAVDESILAAREAGVRTIISHFRPIIGFEDKFLTAVEHIEQALDVGNIYFDANPFNESIMPIYMFLPEWARKDNLETMYDIAHDPMHREKILKDLKSSGIHYDELRIIDARGNPSVVGKTLEAFAHNRGIGILEALLTLMDITRMKALLLYSNVNKELLHTILLHPRALIASNGASLPASVNGKPRRSTHTFSEFLKIAQSKKIPFEEAIQRITSVPAKIFALEKRGVLKEGWFADMVIFKDGKPLHVIVNGSVVVQNSIVSTRVGSGVPL